MHRLHLWLWTFLCLVPGVLHPVFAGEPPYTDLPFYKFAKAYAEQNKIDVYQYHERYMGNKEGIFSPFIETKDGGLLIVGTLPDSVDAVVVKFNAARKVVWRKTFRKAGRPAIEGNSAVETSDGSFYINFGVYVNPALFSQIWILKLDASGKMVWEYLFRGWGNDNNPCADRLHLTKNNGIKIYGHIYPTIADIRAEKDFSWTAEIGPNGKIISDGPPRTDINYANDEINERYP